MCAGETQPRIIGMYTYKGGATKTTTSINLAAVLGHHMGKRVLWVDCDMQCNGTAFFYPELRAPDTSSQAGSQAGGDDDDDAATAMDVDDDVDDDQFRVNLDEPCELQDIALRDESRALAPEQIDNVYKRTPTNLYELLRVAKAFTGLPCEALAGALDKELGKLEPRSLCQREHKDSPIICVPGSAAIVKFEAEAGTLSSMEAKALYAGLLRMLVHAACRKFDCEIAILDFGPSAGNLNQLWLANCTHILPCCQPDLFNTVSMDGLLTSVLPQLLERRTELLRIQKESADTFKPVQSPWGQLVRDCRLPPSPPRLFFSVISCFGRNGGKITKAHGDWLLTMRKYFEAANIPSRVRDLYVPAPGNMGMCVPLVPYAHSACPYSATVAVPITMLGPLPSDPPGHKVRFWDRAHEQRRQPPKTARLQAKEAAQRFRALATFILTQAN